MASAAVTERCKKNKNLLEWLDSIILAVAVLSLVFTFAARAIRVDGHSMDPTLHDQQLLIINSQPFNIFVKFEPRGSAKRRMPLALIWCIFQIASSCLCEITIPQHRNLFSVHECLVFTSFLFFLRNLFLLLS